MKWLLKIGAFIGALLTTTVAMATTPGAVQTAATGFETQFTADMGYVGGAIVGMAFLSIGYKWVKGAIFS